MTDSCDRTFDVFHPNQQSVMQASISLNAPTIECVNGIGLNLIHCSISFAGSSDMADVPSFIVGHSVDFIHRFTNEFMVFSLYSYLFASLKNLLLKSCVHLAKIRR